MSPIANRRKLLEAAHALANTLHPSTDHYQAMTTALAQIFSDDAGVPCECVIRLADPKPVEGAQSASDE